HNFDGRRGRSSPIARPDVCVGVRPLAGASFTKQEESVMPIHKRLLSWLVALSMVALAAASATAQTNTGTVSGTVGDAQGQRVPGATVTLTNEGTGVARTATSDPGGGFKYLAVPPGSYRVRVELSGFQTLERTHNVLSASGAIDLGTLKLAVGTMNEVVTVEVQGTQVETASSDRAALLTSTQLAQIH